MLVASVSLCGVFASSAAAENYVVTTLEDSEKPFNECYQPFSELCTLRHAIERANEQAEESSTITFEVAGTIHLEGLPIESTGRPLTIDATTLEDYEGEPLVEIDGTEVSDEGATAGLHAHAELNVNGLAIGGFTNGIVDHTTENVGVCAGYLGVRLDGETALPNAYGFYADGEFDSEPPFDFGSDIGKGCGGLGGNLISGNEFAGVLDEGINDFVAGNRIGLDAFGRPLPNGTALSSLPRGGVVIGLAASEPTIGAYFDGEGVLGAPNQIAYNNGPGVLVESGLSEVWVKRNSIFDNVGLGIEIEAALPTTPTITGFSVAGGSATATGTIQTPSQESGNVEVFAGAECDPSGAGEGEVFLGTGDYETDDGGQGSFNVTGLLPPPAGATVITATATSGSGGSTTEFSTCFALKPAEEPKQPPVTPPPPDTGLHPVNGKLVVAEVQEGPVLVKKPGEKEFKALAEGEEIPVGSIVDATKGKVVLTTINGAGEEQSATFFGGKFLVQQNKGSGLVTLTLKGGDFSSCKKKGQASASKRNGRSLWGSGKGNFKTKGNHGSATVRGTIWFTEDRCNSTFFKVKQGVVTVRDFDAGRTLKLPAGKSYTAKP